MTRQMPANHDAETYTLGSMLLSRDAAILCGGLLKPEAFSDSKHRRIFEAIMVVADKGDPVDFLTVSEVLRQKKCLEEVGGIRFLAALANSVPTAANAEYYAQQVIEPYLRRQLLRAANELAGKAYDDSIEAAQLLDEAERLIFAITQSRTSRDYRTIHDVMLETITHLEKLYIAKGAITGVSTGFKELDRLTAGWQPSDLIIIAARPSMGKTSFVLHEAMEAALKHKTPVALFSLEMSAVQLGMKLVASQSNIDSQALRVGKFQGDDWKSIAFAASTIGETAFFIDDTPGIAVNEIRAKARRMKAESNIGLIVVDYLQLMQSRSRSENRQQEVAEISRSLKALARELDLPVIACSQLSRAVEARSEKIPNLSDLRESGSLEQDADIVAFLYREDYYNQDSDRKNVADLIIAKQRNGPTGVVSLYFDRERSRFSEIETRRTEGGTYHDPTPAGHSHSGYSAGSHRQGRRSADD